jgi:proteasome lid subunit RPN8/RPN11
VAVSGSFAVVVLLTPISVKHAWRTNMQNFSKMKTKPRQTKLRRLLRHPRERRLRPRRQPRLRFSPSAWSKLLFMRDRGPTEVGGFGIAPADDLLFVEDIQLARQRCTVISVAFDDSAIAELFDDQVDAGRKPEQFARIWMHTHPGESAEPSHVDEETFERVFGSCDWAIMFILARQGETYCRLGYRTGPGGAFEIQTEVDFDRPFSATDCEAWAQEYTAAVQPAALQLPAAFRPGESSAGPAVCLEHDFFDLWEQFDPQQENLLYERPL